MRNKNNHKEKILSLHLKGVKPQDIAKQLDISIGSVKMCISRLKRKTSLIGDATLKPSKLQKSIRKDFKEILQEIELPQVTKDFLSKKQNNIGFLALSMTEHVANYLMGITVIKSREERETLALKIKAIQLINTMFASNQKQ